MSELVEKKTIGEVEHIVHASGHWDGTGPVEFSNDGATWAQAWTPTEDHAHPEFARVEVYRKDVRIPTTVTIRWAEQYPAASEEWAGKWDRSPMRHFGRTARMVGFRQTFRDLLGDIVIEDEGDERATAATAAATEPVERDWAAEIAAAQSDELLNEIEKDARAARIFTPDAKGTALHRQLRARRRELEAAWQDAATAWDVPAEEQAESAPARPTPQDNLPPSNRAERRKAARKKGRR
jgi:hypothetical protein